MKSTYYHSRGIALLTTLLVVSIASIIGVSMMKKQWFDIRKTQNLQRMEQSWLYAQGVDVWAVGRLQDDIIKNKVDSEHDGWSQPIQPTEVEGGQLSAAIYDQQGRFNINNLLATGDAGDKQLERFRRLLTVLDLSQQLVEPLLDWLDADSDIHYPNGAEDNHYMAKTPSYRPANQAMVDTSELKLIKGYTEEIYRTLKPYVSALPGIVDINVNGATEQVLQSLGKDLTQQDVQAVIESRVEQPFEDVSSFIQHQALAGREIEADGLAVSSQYFSVVSDVQVGQQKTGYRSTIFRENKDHIRVIWRVKIGVFDE